MPDSVYAKAPFDHAEADVILRSSDGIHFRVFKLFLSVASPFFETLFNIPQPVEANKEQEIRDGLAVIPVTEDSNILDALLRFCYPCTVADDPDIEVAKDALGVYEAARKYSLDAIEKKACQAISNPKILEAEPFQCFAIARRGCLQEETLLAAKYTLKRPLVPSWFREVELITTADLLSLLSYHQRCGEAVYALRLDLSWIRFHYRGSEACSWLSGRWQYRITHEQWRNEYKNCGCLRSDISRYALFDLDPPQWWEDLMENSFIALRDKPCQETLRPIADMTVRSVKAENCRACSPKVIEGMRDFVDLFTKKIEQAVSQVELKFTR